MSHKKFVATIIIIFILIACGYVLIKAENKIDALGLMLIPLIGLAVSLYGIRSATGVLIKRKEIELTMKENKDEDK